MSSEATDRDDIIRKIQKLLNVTVENGASAGTEEAHQKKARELMDKHQLSMLDVKAKRYNEGIYSHPLFERDDKGRPPMWAYDFSNAIARAFDCVCLFTGGMRICDRIQLIGHDSDVKLCSFMVDSLSRTLLPQAQQAADAELRRAMDVHYYDDWTAGKKAARKRKFIVSFMIGAGVRIKTRLLAQKEKAHASQPDAGAMVLVKKGQIDEWLKKEEPNVKDVKGSPPPDAAGQRAGCAAGDKVNLNRPIEGGGLATPVGMQLALGS
jgi:hypothetical protein